MSSQASRIPVSKSGSAAAAAGDVAICACDPMECTGWLACFSFTLAPTTNTPGQGITRNSPPRGRGHPPASPCTPAHVQRRSGNSAPCNRAAGQPRAMERNACNSKGDDKGTVSHCVLSKLYFSLELDLRRPWEKSPTKSDRCTPIPAIALPRLCRCHTLKAP